MYNSYRLKLNLESGRYIGLEGFSLRTEANCIHGLFLSLSLRETIEVLCRGRGPGYAYRRCIYVSS